LGGGELVAEEVRSDLRFCRMLKLLHLSPLLEVLFEDVFEDGVVFEHENYDL